MAKTAKIPSEAIPELQDAKPGEKVEVSMVVEKTGVTDDGMATVQINSGASKPPDEEPKQSFEESFEESVAQLTSNEVDEEQSPNGDEPTDQEGERRANTKRG